MNIQVREQLLPGIGRRFEFELRPSEWLVLTAERDGARSIAVVRPGHDEPDTVVDLSVEQAVTLGALLLGARFSADRDVSTDEADAVTVETVTLSGSSPAVGNLVSEVPLTKGAQAAILAVICDETPELLEDLDHRPCRAGDRVVVAARADRMAEVVRNLAG